MNQRRALKKAIYKAKENNQDTTDLENRLFNLKLSDKERLQQIRQEIILNINHEMTHLEIEYQTLYLKVSEKEFTLPYRIRYILNQRNSTLADKIENKFYGKKIEIHSIPDKFRYIYILVDSVLTRLNIETKQEYINKNWFWFQHQNRPKSYKNCLNLKR